MRLIRLVFVCALLSLVAPVTAMAAERMWVGFQDDPSFRWRDDRATMLDEAVRSNAGIVRTTVYWSRIAPFGRPALEPVRPGLPVGRPRRVRPSAQFRGLESLLTIWGTPNWANRSKGPNYAPTRLSDITAFAARSRRATADESGIPVRSVLQRLERAQPRAVPRRRSTARASPYRRSRTRSSTEPSTPA